VENPAAFKYTSPQGKEELVRVFYLPRITASKQLNDVLSAGAQKSGFRGVFYTKPAGVDSARHARPDGCLGSLIVQSDIAAR